MGCSYTCILLYLGHGWSIASHVMCKLLTIHIFKSMLVKLTYFSKKYCVRRNVLRKGPDMSIIKRSHNIFFYRRLIDLLPNDYVNSGYIFCLFHIFWMFMIACWIHIWCAILSVRGTFYKKWKCVQYDNNMQIKLAVPCIIHITVTSLWAWWRLKSPGSPLFAQRLVLVQIKENIKAPRHWPLRGKFTRHQWIPHTKRH